MEIRDHKYYDGGMESNNPVIETIEEAYRLYGGDARIGAIVSIGTGKSEVHEPSNPITFIQSITARATDTESKHNGFKRHYKSLQGSYFRLQEPDALGEIDLAASDKLEEIEKLAEEYLISEEGQALVSQCAQKLRRST